MSKLFHTLKVFFAIIGALYLVLAISLGSWVMFDLVSVKLNQSLTIEQNNEQ